MFVVRISIHVHMLVITYWRSCNPKRAQFALSMHSCLLMHTYVHNVPQEEHMEMAPLVHNIMWQWGDSKYGIEHVMMNLWSRQFCWEISIQSCCMGLVHLILFSCHSTVLSLSNTYAFLACESHLSAESSGIAKLGKTRAQTKGLPNKGIAYIMHVNLQGNDRCNNIPLQNDMYYYVPDLA